MTRRPPCSKNGEVLPEAIDRLRGKSQSDNLLFSQAMFPASEVRNESGKTIKTRWNNLEAQEVIFDIYPDGLEEQARLHLIEKHALGKWADFSGEIPNEFKTIKQIEVIERKYIKEIYKRKKHKLKAYQAAQFKDKDLILMARIPVPFSNSQSAHSAILVF